MAGVLAGVLAVVDLFAYGCVLLVRFFRGIA